MRVLVQLAAQPLGQHLPGQAVAVLIPVTAAEIVAKAMEKNLVLGGVFLEGRRQKLNRNAFGLAELGQPAIRIEQVLNPQLLGGFLPDFGVGMNLHAVGEHHHEKPGPVGRDFIPHHHEHRFRDFPGFLPNGFRGCAENGVQQSEFRTVRRGSRLSLMLSLGPPGPGGFLGLPQDLENPEIILPPPGEFAAP